MAENAAEIYFADHRPPLRQRFFDGCTFAELLARPKDNGVLWEAIYKRARISEQAAGRGKNVTIQVGGPVEGDLAGQG